MAFFVCSQGKRKFLVPPLQSSHEITLIQSLIRIKVVQTFGINHIISFFLFWGRRDVMSNQLIAIISSANTVADQILSGM